MPTTTERLTSVFQRVAVEFKTVRSELTSTTGDLALLSTTAKNNLVAAINELESLIQATNEGALGINDTAPSTSTVYSSTKIDSELAKKAELVHRHDNASTTVDGFMAAADKVKLDGLAAGGAALDDASINSTTKGWSASKITSAIEAAKTELLGGAPGALDTLKELAEALGNDPDFAANIFAALDMRVAVNSVQGFTPVQQKQGRDNISVSSTDEIGDTAVDLVALFNGVVGGTGGGGTNPGTGGGGTNPGTGGGGTTPGGGTGGGTNPGTGNEPPENGFMVDDGNGGQAYLMAEDGTTYIVQE